MFLLDLAAELSDCDVTIAGGVSQSLQRLDVPENLRLFGPIDGSEKERLLSSADLVVNPVTRGSGTSLKSVEALAAFLPMVATPEAVRGLGLEPGRHAIVVERNCFAPAIRWLLAAPERRRQIAEEGLALARRKFTWPAIARRLASDLRAAVAVGRSRRRRPPRRPLVVALNDYPIGAATSGGAVRMKEVLKALGADVILLAFGAAYDAVLLAPGLLQVTLEKSPRHRAFEEQINAGQTISVNDIVAALFLGCDHVFAELVSQLAARCTAVMFEHCYMAPALDWLRPVRPDLPIVYDAHNVEAEIKAELLREHPLRDPLLGFVVEIEHRLTAAADLVVTCTESDAEHFRRAGARTLVVGNGSAPAASREPRRAAGGDGAIARIGFLGSAHRPNAEAAWYIIDALAPRFGDARFELVGPVCDAVSGPLPRNLVLHGVVDDARKAEILGGWHVALNPVRSGGGSSLKLPDYLAHGLPTLSTPQGARGFAVAAAEIGEVVERHEFPAALSELLDDPGLRSEYARRAREYAARHLTWQAQAAPLRAWFEELGDRRDGGGREPRRSLLVVTYRYTEPPLGGAEEYLVEVLRWLRPRFGTIELAAVDVEGALTNRHHFGCVFAAGGGAARVLGKSFDCVRLFPPDAIPDDTVLAICRQLERAWLRAELDLFGGFAAALRRPDAVILLAGFYWPEANGEGTVRWSAPEFAFLIPPGTRVFGVDGWTPKRKQIVVSAIKEPGARRDDAVELHRQYIDANFSCKLALEGDAAPAVILCSVDEHDEPNDYRPFGILLERASAWVRSGDSRSARNDPHRAFPLREIRAELEKEIEPLLRTEHVAAWVERLAAVARSRPEGDEAAFAAVRGPHSAAMQAWLRENAAHYDVALVQGVPFDTVPSSVATLAERPERPRIVVLPHFHGEDRFYYWRRYLESFAAADKTLFFSESLAARLAVPAKNVVVPGGGIRIDEEASAVAIARFRQVHPSPVPFFLVLGRKVPWKGYERVILATGSLRAAGRALDLVIIGQDEDGIPIEARGVHYLGRQPREAVLGALSACIGLVTMSDTESFGIVVCEAWKFRKPVIANRVCSAFRELIDHGKTGLLVGSDAELVAAMGELAADPALCARLGDAGFERAIARFTWQRVADCVGAVLSDPAAASAPARRPHQGASSADS